jgi:nitroreductase
MAACDPETAWYRRREIALRFVVRAAAGAPSIYNTQPWRFAAGQRAIRLYADPGRQLAGADPDGRELLISCGAALCNAGLAMRHLGFAAEVRLFPRLDRPDLLAEIGWGRYLPPAGEEALYQSIPRRHTHRGAFAADAPPELATELAEMTWHDRAGLQFIYDPARRAALAELTRIAEEAQRSCPELGAERGRWTRLPGDPRCDGVPADPCPPQPDGPQFAIRDYVRSVRRRPAPLPDPRAPGLVALLCTRDDSREARLLAGHALQRLLLYATAHQVSAAFHTQPLEFPRMRERIRAGFAEGAYPQMLLRLGYASDTTAAPRRPVVDLLPART